MIYSASNKRKSASGNNNGGGVNGGGGKGGGGGGGGGNFGSFLRATCPREVTTEDKFHSLSDLRKVFPGYSCFNVLSEPSYCSVYRAVEPAMSDVTSTAIDDEKEEEGSNSDGNNSQVGNSDNNNCSSSGSISVSNSSKEYIVPVAIKKISRLLLTGVTDSSGARYQGPSPFWVQREISILRKLKHPNIVRLVDVICPNFEEEKVASIKDLIPIYMVLELSTCDLKVFIRNNAADLNINGVKNIFAQIMFGLQYLHSANVIHRDVKPENILLNIADKGADKFIVKISDFGLSKIVDTSQIAKSSSTANLNINCASIHSNCTSPIHVFSTSKFAEVDEQMMVDFNVGDVDDNYISENIPDVTTKLENNKTATTATTTDDDHLDISIDMDDPENETSLEVCNGNGNVSSHSTFVPLKRLMSATVATQGYRAPEILLYQDYSSSVDIWSAGCILAELFSAMCDPSSLGDHMRLFSNQNDRLAWRLFELETDEERKDLDEFYDKMVELSMIFTTLGATCIQGFSGYRKDAFDKLIQLEDSVKIMQSVDFAAIFPKIDSVGIDFLLKMIDFNPQRWTVEDCLRSHSFLSSEVQGQERFNANICSQPLDASVELSLAESNILNHIVSELSYFRSNRHLKFKHIK